MEPSEGTGVAEPEDMESQTAVFEELEQMMGYAEAAEEPTYDRLPGMPLVAFLTASLFSLGIWAALGWVVWTLIS